MSRRTRAAVALFVLALLAVLAVSANGAATKKTPVKIMLIGTQSGAVAFPETVTGASAAVKAINASGGINGHPIVLEVCDNKLDNNLDAACGRQAVSDKVVALVGGFALVDGHYPIVEAAKLPEVGVYGSTPAAFNYPYYYPLTGYTFGGAGGPPAALADFDHDSKVVYFSGGGTSASAAFAQSVVGAVLQARGLPFSNVTMPAGTADPFPYLQRALDMGADGLVFSVSAGDADRLTRLARQVAPQVDIARSTTTVNQNTIANLGKSLNGVTISSQFLPSSYTEDAGVRQWNKEMLAYDNNATFSDFSANSWAAVHVFAQAATGLKTITPATVAKRLNTLRAIDTLIGPKVSFIRPLPPAALGGTDYKRVFNVKLTYNAVIGGRIVNTVNGRWYNPFSKPKKG